MKTFPGAAPPDPIVGPFTPKRSRISTAAHPVIITLRQAAAALRREEGRGDHAGVLPAYAGMILDRALADNSIAMMERRSMNDRRFRLNVGRLKKGKGFLISQHTDCLDTWKHTASALMRKPFGMLCGKAMDAAVRTSAFARALVPWKTRMGRR